MIKYSTRLTNECRKAFISQQSKAIADLMIMGWTPQDAYIAVGLNNPAMSDEYHEKQISQLVEDRKFSEYTYKKQKKTAKEYHSASTDESDEQAANRQRLRTKDGIIDELSATLENLHGKEKADVLMKIADLQQMKKEEIIEEDNTVHFYVPIKCVQCSLYIAAQKKARKKEED